MKSSVNRIAVDLSAYPDLVVIYLGMRVNAWTGLKTLFGIGPQIVSATESKPDGLLRHETMLFSLLPPHLGMRQYWRDFEALERWAKSDPHRQWWTAFLRNSGGTGFWHETYFMAGGMEAIYDDIESDIGFRAFAPQVPAKGPMFSARSRAKRGGGESSQA